MSGVGVTMSVTGVDGILKNLIEKSAQADAAVEKAVFRLALLVERLAKDEYVPVVTGRLKASIGGKLAPPPQHPGDALFVAKRTGPIFDVLIGSNVVYAAIVEFGRRPRPGMKGVRRRGSNAVTGSNTTRRGNSNGRHGPFLYPALLRAIEIGGPVLRAELKRAIGLA